MEIENILTEAKKNFDELKHDSPSLSSEQKEMENISYLANIIVENNIEEQLKQGKLSKQDVIEVIEKSIIIGTHLKEFLNSE